MIDCRPTLGVLTVNALFAANFILVPITMSRYALEGFADLLDTISEVKGLSGEQLGEFMRILVSNFDQRNRVVNEWVMNELGEYY